MVKYILLDSTPLGLLVSRSTIPLVRECARWFAAHRNARNIMAVPEIIDYELRREIYRLEDQEKLEALDFAIFRTAYLAIGSDMMRDAAVIWAHVRRRGLPTAAQADLDIDTILAAQARSIEAEDVVIATSYVKHLSRYFRRNRGSRSFPDPPVCP